MARLTLVLLGFWPCCGIRRSGLNGRTPSQWAAGAVLVVCNHVSWLDILVSHTLHPLRTRFCCPPASSKLNCNARGGANYRMSMAVFNG